MLGCTVASSDTRSAAPPRRATWQAPRRFSRSHSGLRAATAATLVATYCLVVLGSTVRVTESGMGCRSWPLCNGQIGPATGSHALLEESHRYLAAVVTVGVVAVAVLAWRARARAGRRVLVPALWATVLVALQVVLGAVTVFTHNASPTVALHLVGALLLLAAVTATAVGAFLPALAHGSSPRARPRWDRLDSGALVTTFALLVSGAVVVDSGAAAACPSWPGCESPPGVPAHLVVFQLVHRSFAAAAIVLLAVLVARSMLQRRSLPGGVVLASFLGILLPAQVAAGAVSAVLRAPEAAQDVHLALAAAIWASAVALVACRRAATTACTSPASPASPAKPLTPPHRATSRSDAPVLRRTATRVPPAPVQQVSACASRGRGKQHDKGKEQR